LRLVIVLVVTSTLILGCTEQATELDRSQYSGGHIFSYEKGAAIPDQLVSLIEAQYLRIFRERYPDSEKSDVEVITGIPRRLLELNVYLREKNSGTLIDDTRFALPSGGGAIDLAEFVNDGKGIFYVDWEVNLEAYEIDPMALKVYFVSNNHKFKVGKEVFGTGCGAYFEITTFFSEVIQVSGYEVAAADKRYLGQMLGTFYFVAMNPSGIYVAATSFLDTRYPKVHCLPPQLGGAYN
jgi:hypothetical protein